ncbi:hypothetical protein SAMN05192558_101414 [Actinokineospora alba]|uniref:Transmembrane protein n=1 Tax=Actinokineospora alba TaxID=504798 RepID=A0A1H0FKJ5_9PSEU|nr:hypothetical protein [Actinokineospora alba]TDP69520.1 hypothetical protein C8E96_5110 [Actinokineospora alba]SDI15003.1 hypothetical protein SAMN05421871_103457 [Actinokineospora alba]SDN95288.1 hypothetical protein SAMN05192558_101414 [Actinokineospora alba]
MLSTMDLSRLVRRFWPGRSSLARPSDWIEAGSLLILVLLLMVAVPVAGAVGSEVYNTTSQLAQRQRDDRTPTTATLLDPAPGVERGALGELVRASWVQPDEQVAVGKVSVRQEAAAGDRVDIWVDRSGEVTLAPMTDGGAVVAAVATGVIALCLGVVGLLLAYLLVRWSLDRFRLRRWADEWTRVRVEWTTRQE